MIVDMIVGMYDELREVRAPRADSKGCSTGGDNPCCVMIEHLKVIEKKDKCQP
jgi:hypothetical protein